MKFTDKRNKDRAVFLARELEQGKFYQDSADGIYMGTDEGRILQFPAAILYKVSDFGTSTEFTLLDVEVIVS